MEQSSNNFNVSGFLETLQRTQPQAKAAGVETRKIDKVSLSFNGNHGKYQILPMNSTITGFPFRELKNTREIQMPKVNTLPDGSVREFTSWIKILPNDAYLMVDSTGRVVSSLTRDEEELLIQARSTFDTLYELMGGKEKDQNLNKTIGFLRRRDYTVFHGKCLGKWGMADPRTPERTNFPALFICSAKGFMQAVSDNVTDETLANGGNSDWLSQVYSRQTTGRTGFLIFSISMNQGGKIGYSISVNHKAGIMNPEINNHVITEEEEALMTDPVETFLGWQGRKDPETGRMFNRALMQEVIAYMGNMIQSIQMAKTTGADMVEAWKATSELALKNSQTAAPTTTDPFLANSAAQVAPEVVNPGNLYTNNNDPFSTPPAAHIDPITQQPVNPGFGGGSNYGAAPQFEQPSFAQVGVNTGSVPFGGFGGGSQMNDPFQN